MGMIESFFMAHLDPEKRRIYQREWKAKRAAAGRCQSCGEHNPRPAKNPRLCPPCHANHLASKRKSQNAKHATVKATLEAQIAALQAQLRTTTASRKRH